MSTIANPEPVAASLRRGVLWNLAGQVLPAAAALVALPVIQARLGTAQLGVLALAWATIGYLGVVDLGFRRTLTREIAAARPMDAPGLASLVWTTWWSLAAFGTLAGIVLVLSGPWLLPAITAAGPNSVAGAWVALVSVAVALPCVAVASGARGVLEGHRRFALLNATQIPISLLGYAAPAIVALATDSVVPALITLAGTRVLGAIVGVIAAASAERALRNLRPWRRTSAAQLARSGSWMMVANLAAAAMTYLDRLIVGLMAPLSAVAYYVTPQELLGKLQVISAATSTTTFPALATLANGNRTRLTQVYRRATLAVLLLLGLPAVALAALAPVWLEWWMGAEFAREAAVTARWIAIGTAINGVAAIPFALLQAMHRERFTAAVQLVELPAYAALLIWMTGWYGIQGAAAAWVIRVTVDAAVLFAAAAQARPRPVRGQG